ncbi:Flp family type IVb pilin [Vibrio barjaei]|uniref:Flp family type IVb pilin n=1 Tax=Vibrio barjaei TaxID=1676683 RepID=A0ABW7IHJ7_9VIBR|nr:hypothetical protein [Vibrio barjaei]MCG9787136.1 hypothetical protein [Vibrio mediterranei]MCY9873316.1 hypothetical protein [Vibrio barjaei]
MSSIKTLVKDFLSDEEGLTLIEYLLGAALIILAFAAASPWNALKTALDNVISDAESGG